MESGEMNTEILGVALQIVLLIVISYPLGKYIAKVYKGEKTWSDFMKPVERLIYKVAGVNPEEEMNWKQFLKALLILNAFWFVWYFLLHAVSSYWLTIHFGEAGNDSAVSFQQFHSKFTRHFGIDVKVFTCESQLRCQQLTCSFHGGKTITTQSSQSGGSYFICTVQTGGTKFHDTGIFFAAYVNEENPMIDQLLREALNTRIVNRFLGYQGGPEAVDNQVYALWNVLQKRKFRYSSVSNTSLSSNVVFSQRVRTFDDALESSQINCVDGSVLFASLLRAINMEPIQ